ncbi:lysozyme [Pseudocitrobacter sp. RIT415]|uniref:glycoside hydrolase family 24 protein n=1 Tax=Pseudocitrobacter sp. RIT415 TaxID=2202163 RepID=UPI000D3C1D20|nr:glycoside hydrolase family 104 protein [Pseudocitrobacter sp. RIT 415]RAU45261.1 lysozyme [Pseudocitrobacter sp. RIT 415]
MNPNIQAFMKTIRFSEGTLEHPLTTNEGYDVIVTGSDGKPEVFTDYSDHPFANGRPGKVFNKAGQRSTASGGYQVLYKFWPTYKEQLGLKDFSPESQDKLCMQLLKERRAVQDIEDGYISRAIEKCSNIWASFPGAGYGQCEHKIEVLLSAFERFGGKLAQVA